MRGAEQSVRRWGRENGGWRMENGNRGAERWSGLRGPAVLHERKSVQRLPALTWCCPGHCVASVVNHTSSTFPLFLSCAAFLFKVIAPVPTSPAIDLHRLPPAFDIPSFAIKSTRCSQNYTAPIIELDGASRVVLSVVCHSAWQFPPSCCCFCCSTHA